MRLGHGELARRKILQASNQDEAGHGAHAQRKIQQAISWHGWAVAVGYSRADLALFRTGLT